MRVRFWGVRGSAPVPGLSTLRYGGNTACVSVDLSPSATLVIDAGTGLRELGASVGGGTEEHTYYILLSHLHWDHIQGIPLFKPVWDETARIEFLVGPNSDWGERVMEQFDGIHFPLSSNEIPADIVFRREPQSVVLAPFFDHFERIRTNHPGLCYGYRLGNKTSSLVYMTDNEIGAERAPSVAHIAIAHTSDQQFVSFCDGADHLIHDAQFTDLDFPEKRGWGHSEVSATCRLAADAGVRNLYLFHHDPSRSDDEIDRIGEFADRCLMEHGSNTISLAAEEGIFFNL